MANQFRSTGVTEGGDDTKFGGLVFEDNTGLLVRTVRWTEAGLAITKYVGERPYAATLVQRRGEITTAGASVGRIKFVSAAGIALLSGWVSGQGNSRFFISSSHGFPVDGSVTQGVVSFASVWEGEIPFAGDVTRVFDVTFESALAAAEILVWKFAPADLAAIPAPLSYDRTLQDNDQTVALGYCVVPTQAKLTEYFDAVTDPVKAHAFAPDVGAAVLAFHPNNKVVSPGTVLQGTRVVRGNTLHGVKASMYHGMSGGPILLLDNNNVLGVSAQVVGNTETLALNANTILDITSGAVRNFLNHYMT